VRALESQAARISADSALALKDWRRLISCAASG